MSHRFDSRRTTRAPLIVLLLAFPWGAVADERDESPLAVLGPVFANRCLECHGGEGEAVDAVDLGRLKSVGDLVREPRLVEKLLKAVEARKMPPEEADTLPDDEHRRVVERLRVLLGVAIREYGEPPRTPIRRMNRFQYANAVRDLLDLNVLVFRLPERMMREHGDYFQPSTGVVPEVVNVGSRPLGKSQLIEPSLVGVTAFPRDPRAEHGFDNRGDHLSLSPLLLEQFLRLGRSIVESPNLDAATCGVWNELFAPPPPDDARDRTAIVRGRLRPFLSRAFRRPIDDDLLGRYAEHVTDRIEAGETFTSAMKSAVAGVLASPRFLYLYDAERGEDAAPDDFDLASRLSFLLWGSIPDGTLLERAAAGSLHDPDVLRREVDRMLRDRRLKRFCDSFPSQWLQLDRIVSSVPDPQRYPAFYHTNEKYRASMHMMLEPLLLFETVLIEDRSILELIDPPFSYRSELLQRWYRDGRGGNPGSPAVVTLRRVPVEDRRFGGVITNAAVMTMTSGPRETKPITRGAWLATVILNDPPEPPPADVPPLEEEPEGGERHRTLRERFAEHRTRASCAACHESLDPLGFALENFDPAGFWREKYDNGRAVDPSGRLFGEHEFTDVVQFKDALLAERDRFTRAFAAHLLSFALGRAVDPTDGPALDEIVRRTAEADYRLHAVVHAIVASRPFSGVGRR